MNAQEKTDALRDKFKKETGLNWINSQGEPDIDYVWWLEKQLMSNQRDGLFGFDDRDEDFVPKPF